MSAPSMLRTALARGFTIIPGCHDPLSARLAADAGATAVFLAGSATGRALFGEEGIPTRGASTYLSYVRIVCAASPLPVLVDGEDGFGDPVGLCAELAAAGAAGVVIGDGRPDGGLAPVDVLAGVIDEVRGGLLVVPRADGTALDRADTCRRLARYREAGAELVLPLLTSVLRTESPDEQLATYTGFAAAAGGALALHSRRGDELPPTSRLPPGVAALLLSGLSVPVPTDALDHPYAPRRKARQ